MNQCNAAVTGMLGSMASVEIDSINYDLASKQSELDEIEKI